MFFFQRSFSFLNICWQFFKIKKAQTLSKKQQFIESNILFIICTKIKKKTAEQKPIALNVAPNNYHTVSKVLD